MIEQNILTLRNFKTLLLIAVLLTAISLAVSLFQTPKYKASAKLLVVFQEKDATSFDANRTSGYVTNVLSEVAYSNSFINAVFESDTNIKDELGADIVKRQNNWKDTAVIRAEDTKGIIAIDVLHRDRDQAKRLAQAITQVLTTKHQNYHGAGELVTIRVIDAPAVSNRYAQPNIPLNALLGFVIGIIVGATFIIIFPNQRLFEFIFDRKSFYGDEAVPLHVTPTVPANTYDTLSTPASNQYDFGVRDPKNTPPENRS